MNLTLTLCDSTESKFRCAKGHPIPDDFHPPRDGQGFFAWDCREPRCGCHHVFLIVHVNEGTESHPEYRTHLGRVSVRPSVLSLVRRLPALATMDDLMAILEAGNQSLETGP